MAEILTEHSLCSFIIAHQKWNKSEQVKQLPADAPESSSCILYNAIREGHSAAQDTAVFFFKISQAFTDGIFLQNSIAVQQQDHITGGIFYPQVIAICKSSVLITFDQSDSWK